MTDRPSIAVIGASRQRHKFGNKAVRAYLAAGWDVHPVNLDEREIEGRPVLPSVADLPRPLDRISVYLPPADTLGILDQIALNPPGEVWFNPGSADDAVRRRVAELGLPARYGCSIVDVGMSPAQFP